MTDLIGLLNGSGGVVVVGHQDWAASVRDAAKPGTSIMALPEIDDEIIEHPAWWLPLFGRDVVLWPTCQSSTLLFSRVAALGRRLGLKSLWWHSCAGEWNKRGTLERLI